MAENKAGKALKEAESKNYKVELVVAQTRVESNNPMVIDLSGYFEDSEYPSVHPFGIRVSTGEENLYLEPCRPLYEEEDMLAMRERAKRIVRASIVNAKQLESVEGLIDDAFMDFCRERVNAANDVVSVIRSVSE